MSWFLLALGANLDPEVEWSRIHPSDATASSYLQSAYNRHDENYHPRYLLDDDPKTAWTEGVEGLGEGESIRLLLASTPDVSAVKLRIQNGYQKSSTLLRANAAPAQLRITLLDADNLSTTTHLAQLTQTAGWQEVTIPTAAPVALSSILLEVVSTHPGQTYPDTCISDVQVWVDAAVNATQSEANHAAVMDWIAARQVAAAQTDQPLPFVAQQFRKTSERSLPDLQQPPDIELMMGLIAEGLDAGVLTRGEPVRAIPPVKLGDALTMLSLSWLFDLDNIHFSTTAQHWRGSRPSSEPMVEDVNPGNVRVLRDEAGAVRALVGQVTYTGRTGSSSAMRMFYTGRHTFAARYASGSLSSLLVEVEEEHGAGEDRYFVLMTFQRSASGQVEAITAYRGSPGGHWAQLSYQAG